ncbi:MAG: enoyl-CoA hydratase/isomerase family protein [Acidobacteria bacterium]|nr:enoyl-CoA hydratase/isomerase family protein [Acidobacteriota bacterium]MBV9478270.1 enoyl-CoA hydratase/isomerase family protein [Acidobacteriota bacterium]
MTFISTAIDGAVATITLDRSEKLNAFSGTMREDLLAALRACDGDERVRVVVITGAGRAFCAGGDVEYMAKLQESDDVASFRKLLDAGRDVVLQLASMAKPVIASINGVAAGAGCNLALACDYRIASDVAKLGETFVRIGLHPDWGGTWLLPRLVGNGRALELMATGRMVDAAEAERIGMVDRVVPAAELARETAALAQAIAGGSPLAVQGIKRALAASERNDLRAQLELEAEHQLQCFASDEAKAKIAAFAKK